MVILTTPITVASLTTTNIATDASQPAPQRLIVLISQQEMDDNGLARRIWNLATPRGLKVLYLGLCVDVSREYRLRRRLATLAAITRDDRIFVETQLAVGNDWFKAVKSIWRPGDLVVCHAEQTVGMRRRPLSVVLVSSLKAPVCTLNGFYSLNQANPSLLKGIISWIGSVAIIAGFFWVQAVLEQLAKDWVHSTLLVLSIPIEIGVLLVWNSLFSKFSA